MRSRTEPSNSALLSDAYTSPLRAHGGGTTRTLEGAVNASREVTLIGKCPSSIASKSSWFTSGFWLGIMVATEIALVGWLISTAIGANATLWRLWAHLARSH